MTKDNTATSTAPGKLDCTACTLKPKRCPNTPARKVPRSIHDAAARAAWPAISPRPTPTWPPERGATRSRQDAVRASRNAHHLVGSVEDYAGPAAPAMSSALAATAQNLRKLAMLIPMPKQFVGEQARTSSSCFIFEVLDYSVELQGARGDTFACYVPRDRYGRRVRVSDAYTSNRGRAACKRAVDAVMSSLGFLPKSRIESAFITSATIPAWMGEQVEPQASLQVSALLRIAAILCERGPCDGLKLHAARKARWFRQRS